MSKVRENATANNMKENLFKKNENVVYVQKFDFTDRTNGQLIYLSNVLNGYMNLSSASAKSLYDSMYKGFVRDFINQFVYKKSHNPIKNSNNSKFINAWKNADAVMIGKDKRNPIKEAAWIVTHSNKFGYKLTWDEFKILVPTYGNDKMIVNWNHFIEVEIKDVDDEIKKMFIIDKSRKAHVFDIMKVSETISDPNRFKEVVEEEKTTTPETKKEEEVKKTEPTDENSEAKKEFEKVVEELDSEVDEEVNDAPVEKAGAEKISDKEKISKLFFDEIRNFAKMTAESNFDESVKDSLFNMLSDMTTKFTAATNPKALTVIDGEFHEVEEDEETKNAKAESKKLDEQMKDAIARDDEKDAKEKKGEVEEIPEHPTEGTLFAENNVPWEVRIPKLNILTNICKDKGYNVSYETCTYPGLVLATVYSLNENKALVMVRQLLVDPMIVYGDTVRVIPITSTDDKFNIRKEMFIPITNKKLIIKAIDGTLTKEDREAFFSKLPRCMSDFRPKYHILDRVDLRCLNADGSPVNFFGWRTLITNISKVLTSKEIPDDIRFRVANFKNGNHFDLVCDDKVLLSIDSDIFNNNENQVVAMTNGLRVEYDADKYHEGKDKNINYKVING